MIFNGDGSPVSILHFSGMPKEKIEENLKKYLTDFDTGILEKQSQYLFYDIITCFSPNLNKDELILVKQLEDLGIPYINAWDYAPERIVNLTWKNTHKLYAYKSCIDYLLVHEKTEEKLGGYVLLLDARDTYLLSLNFKHLYKSYKSVLALFNGNKSDFPNKYGKTTIKSDYPVYLNTGVCFGYKEYISKLYEKAINLLETNSEFGENRSDQYVLREIFQQEENRMRVDEHCRIIQLINECSELIEVENGKHLIVK